MTTAAVAAASAVKKGARFYRPELDVLRFGAFGLVFMAHALPSPATLPRTFQALCSGLENGLGFGVDVFFLLSSYLITELLLREYNSRRAIDVKAFWARRILRIWPLYFAFLALAVWVVPLILPQDFPVFHRLAYATFWGNFALILDSRVNTVAGILWSVSIEEQFYLLWPLVMSGFIGRLKVIATTLVLVAWATRIYLAAASSNGLWTFWSNTPARMDPIAIGALVALLLNGRTPQIANKVRAASITAGFLIITLAGLFFPRAGWGALIGYPLGTAGALLLLLGMLGAAWPFPKWLVHLGKISYGLYVFHILALRLAGAYVHANAPALVVSLVRFGVAISLTVALAMLSFRYFESPFLRLKDRFSTIQSH